MGYNNLIKDKTARSQPVKPDRIIIGEVNTGGDLLKKMSIGHKALIEFEKSVTISGFWLPTNRDNK